MDLFSLTKSGCINNPGGTKSEVYIAPEHWFDSIATLQALSSPELPGEVVTIQDTHTFLATFGFVKLYTTLDKSTLTLETVGERDSRNGEVKLEAFHPGSGKEAAGFAKTVKDCPCIVLCELSRGDFVQIGEERLGAEVLGAFNSGTNAQGASGWTFTISTFQPGLLYYEGTITEKP